MAAAIIAVVVLLVFIVLFLASAIKIVREYERAIVFRLGRLLAEPKARASFF